MDAIIREMKDANTCWNVTIASIILLPCIFEDERFHPLEVLAL